MKRFLVVVAIVGVPGCENCVRDDLRDDFARDDAMTPQDPANRQVRARKWRQCVAACVAKFEVFARDQQKYLARFPMTPRRRKELEEASPQAILSFAGLLEGSFDIAILRDVDADDRDFLKRMFNRRHLFAHKGGTVDQEVPPSNARHDRAAE